MAANKQYLGTNAGINYTTAPSSTTYTQVYKLPVPLRHLQSAFRNSVYVAESLDYSGREVLSVSTGVYELVGTIRFASDHQGTIDFLRYGLQGVPMVYSTANSSNGSSSGGPSTAGTPVYLIEPTGLMVQAALDRDRTVINDFEVPIRLRRTDGASFSTVFS